MPVSNVIADLVSRVLQPVMVPKLTPELRFDEIPGHTSTIAVPTRHGDVRCTVYHPDVAGSAATTEPEEDKPAVYVNIHGGGFVMAHAEQDDPWCRYLAAKAGVVVLNVEYDVAPQRRFPVAVEQVFDVLAWAARHDEWDGSRLCVGGQSAGGSLAAAASRLALENGGPQIRMQMLHYPPLDLVTPAKQKHSPIPRPVIQPWMAALFDPAYVPDPAVRRDRLVSPAWGSNADGLDGIAPALIITCEHDRLRDEAASYARSLDAVGALREHHDIPGIDHGYNIMRFGTRATTEPMYEKITEHVRSAVA